MALSQADRLAFSLFIVGSAEQIAGLQKAKLQIAAEVTKAQKLDEANKNLLDPANVSATAYQAEFNKLDGNLRTTFVESNVVDAAKKILQNYFFPNDTTVVVPDLAASHNVWIQPNPFANNYAIGKNYTEGYGSTQKEGDLISPILGYITAAGGNTDIQNTSGQSCGATGTCSIPMYLTQVTCEANAGIWTPGPDLIANDPAIQTLKTNIVTAVNALKTFLLAEVALIVTNDPVNQTNNQAAINNINNVIIPALNTWLAYVDFNTAHGQTTCSGFNAYNSNLLAPTKLHSAQLTALQSALNTRSSFITTRIGQLNTVLGSITQDLTNGNITASSGLYGKRFSYLALRLNIFGGSLAKLVSLQASSGAQDSIIGNIQGTKSTYMSIVPTSILKAPGNGTSSINVADPSLFAVGDAVYIAAEGQEELQRAVKSITADRIVLNDIVPAKYRPAEKARIYKDMT